MYVTINNNKYDILSYDSYFMGFHMSLANNGESINVYNLKDDIEAHITSKAPFIIRNDIDIKIDEFNFIFKDVLLISQNFELKCIDVHISYDEGDRYDNEEALRILVKDTPSIKEAKAFRSSIEQIANLITDDEMAIANAWAYPDWVMDYDYKVGNKCVYYGTLYKCLANHTSQDTWNPAAAPSLWAKVIDETPTGEYPVWEQPDSTNAYHVGDIVWFPAKDTKLYESLIDNNIWSPSAYPEGWKEVNP